MTPAHVPEGLISRIQGQKPPEIVFDVGSAAYHIGASAVEFMRIAFDTYGEYTGKDTSDKLTIDRSIDPELKETGDAEPEVLGAWIEDGELAYKSLWHVYETWDEKRARAQLLLAQLATAGKDEEVYKQSKRSVHRFVDEFQRAGHELVQVMQKPQRLLNLLHR